ncbi:MAG: XRE family transcriptional regulator, partial [Acidobacteria bacterium]|nr:XRE family transcriptional regulator [Acidobacteriota bacterium]
MKILLHGKSKVFLENNSDKDGEEEEANCLAANLLIPEVKVRQFIERGDRSLIAIKRFAGEFGIS